MGRFQGLPQLTLQYFPLRARAETVRMILAYTGIPYSMEVIPLEEWRHRKPSMPAGQVPVLRVEAPAAATTVTSSPPLSLSQPRKDSGGSPVVPGHVRESKDSACPSSSTTSSSAADAATVSIGEIIPSQPTLLWQAGPICRFVCTLAAARDTAAGDAESLARNPLPRDTSAVEAAVAEAVWQTADELTMVNPVLNWHTVGTPAWAKAKAISEDALRAKMSYIERMYARLDGPFFGGLQPRLGDFHMYHVFCTHAAMDPGIAVECGEQGEEGLRLGKWQPSTGPLAEWVSLPTFCAAIEALPGTSEYLAQRPRGGSKQVGREGSFLWNHSV